ncbi:MAG: hypothetical protein CMA93_01190 [Euryarchaeota archaeon]|nr:hypothetical protein [Euryarchaeota archaeon]
MRSLKFILLKVFKSLGLAASVMALSTSSQFAGMKASQSHLCSTEVTRMSIGITSTHKSSAGTIAEGDSPTESKVAQPGYLQEGSHVLAKTSNKTALGPLEGLKFNILKEIQIRDT